MGKKNGGKGKKSPSKFGDGVVRKQIVGGKEKPSTSAGQHSKQVCNLCIYWAL